MSFNWTPEAVIELKRLHAGDLRSFSMIARELSDIFGAVCSRNACIGKAGRLGLEERKKPPRMHPRRAPRANPKLPRVTKPRNNFNPMNSEPVAPGMIDLPPEVSECAIPMTEAGADACRWPLTDPTFDMLVCGAPIACRSYCQRHSVIAYRPSRYSGPSV